MNGRRSILIFAIDEPESRETLSLQGIYPILGDFSLGVSQPGTSNIFDASPSGDPEAFQQPGSC